VLSRQMMIRPGYKGSRFVQVTATRHSPRRWLSVREWMLCQSCWLLMRLIFADCSGAAQAGLKWLRRAGFGTTANYKSNDDNIHPLQQLNIGYDAHIRYSTFQFTITPALAKRLPIPGGYYDSNLIFTRAPNGKVDRTSIGISRSEADTRTDAIFISKTHTHTVTQSRFYVLLGET
jgi:hypothetical protein